MRFRKLGRLLSLDYCLYIGTTHMTEFWTTQPFDSLPVRADTPIFPVHAGKTFIVTGAAGGIGLALLRLLVGQGAKVAAWDLREEPLREAVQELGSGNILPVVSDMSDRESIEAAFQVTESHFQRIDGLVNNAATTR